MHTRQSPAKAGDCGYAGTLAAIPQIRPTKIDLKKYQFFLGKLISLANVDTIIVSFNWLYLRPVFLMVSLFF